MPYQFDPPTRDQPLSTKHGLWSRVKLPVGRTVLKYEDGRYKTVDLHDPDEPGVAYAYIGGHVHIVTDAEAALLTAAGYGPYLTVVT